MYSLNLPQYVGIFFNSQKLTVAKQKKFRQALESAIPVPELIQTFLAESVHEVRTPIVPGQLGWQARFHTRSFDPALAEKLLDDLGWKKDTSGKRDKEGVPLTFTLTTLANPELTATASWLQKYWQKTGLTVNVEVVESATDARLRLQSRDWETFLIGQTTGIDPDPFPYWHSSQGSRGANLSNYGNREVDAIIEQARKTSDDNQRAVFYEEFQKIFLADLPAILLYAPTYPYVINKKIKGFHASIINTPADRFSSITDWYLKTKKF